MRLRVITECPSPQFVTIFENLSEVAELLEVIYIRQFPELDRGWGELSNQHQSLCWSDLTLKEKARVGLRVTRGSGVDITLVYGYRGLPRIAALLGARFCGTTVAQRSDSNILDVQRESRLKHLMRKSVIRSLIPKATPVLAIGTLNEAYWREYIGMSNVAIVPFETPRFARSTVEPEIPLLVSEHVGRRFIVVGGLEPWKGTDLVLQAFSTWQSELAHDSQLIVVGKGSLAALVQRYAQEDPRIHYLGARSHTDVGEIMRTCDTLIVASRREPWGLVVNEALSLGLTVIASDACGAALDLVKAPHGITFRTGREEDLVSALESSSDLVRPQPLEGSETSDLFGTLEKVWSAHQDQR